MLGSGTDDDDEAGNKRFGLFDGGTGGVGGTRVAGSRLWSKAMEKAPAVGRPGEGPETHCTPSFLST